jgi:dTDP-4-dehydrorhamnose 3,5-epimerase
MKIIEIKSLAVPQVKVIRFARFGDHRGYFTESYRKSDLAGHPDAGFLHGVEFLQVNESYSRPGTIRGLHFQWNPWMGKLVRTVSGHILDLALDIRKGSPSFGKIIAHDMPCSLETGWGEWIWVPPGFAHGVVFLEPTTIEYFCSSEYSPQCEAAISPLAADLDWSCCDPQAKAQFERTTAGAPIVSPRDRDGLSLTQWSSDPRAENFVYGCM